MFRQISDSTTKLRARKLLHKRISSLNDLREIYAIGDVIGKGNFGTVVKAKHRQSELYWAIKIINKRQAGTSGVLAVEREIHILKLVNHPNIIFLDCVFESSKTIYLVFELCIESLAKLFKGEKQFEEAKTINVIKSLASALAYLHKNDIVHRDLKLENILTARNPDDATDEMFIKVTDFGLSTVRTGPGHDNMLHEFCGTLTYMAPEMIATKSYSQQCDVWSMGIIMYVLLIGKFPFFSGNDQQLCKLISREEIDFSGLACSPGAQHLLCKLLEKNPAFRLTAAEVEHHPWIRGTGNLIQTESTNVLDMMRLWREEMLEIPRDENFENHSLTNKSEVETSASSIPDEETSQKTNSKCYSIESKNAVSEEIQKKSLTPLMDRISQEISESKNGIPRESGSYKQCARASSRLPNFSHIPAKVDSNLGNSRKAEIKRRETATSRIQTS